LCVLGPVAHLTAVKVATLAPFASAPKLAVGAYMLAGASFTAMREDGASEATKAS